MQIQCLKYHFMNQVLLYCVITKDLDFSEELINQVTTVAKRGGKYSARKFFEEVIDLHYNPETEQEISISKVEALVQLETADFDESTMTEIAALLQIVSKDSFKNADMKAVKGMMKNPIVLDGRNIFEPKEMRDMGYEYHSIGRR